MGPSVADNVDVKDQLPQGMTFVSGEITQGDGVCVSGICQLGDIGVGETVVIEITADVDSGLEAGDYTNTATVFSDSGRHQPEQRQRQR